jgi:ferric-dicitrate binding protein FerR (iron transport regulator)
MLQDRTWLLIGRKMANEASPQELKELEEILRTNPELHFSLQALTELWHQAPTENQTFLESAYQNHLNRMRDHIADPPGNNDDFVENSTLFAPPGKSFIRRRGLTLATVMVIIMLFATTIYYALLPSSQDQPASITTKASEISTRNGSKTNIVLPDGTKVWLNAGSKLTYDETFGENFRNVILTGEAYFDVVHNADKPFVIHTSAIDIKVLGTEFNVKSYPGERTTEASLIRGSIEVTLKDKRAEKIVMKPNEKLVVSNEDMVEATISSPAKKRHEQSAPIISLEHLNYFSLDSTILETSWVINRLVFEDESFEQVATRMARWYGVDFEFRNEDIKRLRFTGNFKNETVEEALKAMQITADFKYRITDKNIVITKN